MKVKNREKFREEILKNARAIGEEEKVSACEFINRIVFPTFGDGVSCSTINCAWCKFLLGIWLEEEYVEPLKPEVDWSKVPVDTLVRVRDSLNKDWKLAFFKGFYPHKEFKFATWKNAETSKTGHEYEEWMFCELVEEEGNEE